MATTRVQMAQATNTEISSISTLAHWFQPASFGRHWKFVLYDDCLVAHIKSISSLNTDDSTKQKSASQSLPPAS